MMLQIVYILPGPPNKWLIPVEGPQSIKSVLEHVHFPYFATQRNRKQSGNSIELWM